MSKGYRYVSTSEHKTKGARWRNLDCAEYGFRQSTAAERKAPERARLAALRKRLEARGPKMKRDSGHRDVIAAMMQMAPPRSVNGVKSEAACQYRNAKRRART